MWVLAFVFVLSFAWPNMTASAQTSSMKLVVDGVEVEGYEQPFMSQEDVLIPVETLFHEAGYQVSKDDAGKVTVTNSYLTVDFSVADEQITVDDEATDALFPLTLKNYGNYVSGEFLNGLEGFEVTISEDQQTVTVTTNRVQDVDAFIEKMVAANPNSYAAKMSIDQSMVSDTEELALDMLMDIDMSVTNNPIGLHMLENTKTTMDGKTEETASEAYFTEDGFFQKIGEDWTKLPEELTAGLLEATSAQADPVAQLELTKQFMKGIHIFEYDDAYIITQTMTNEEFQDMMEEAMSLFTDMVPENLFIDSEAVEVTEATDVKEEQAEEEATVVQEETATEEADEEATTEENAAVEETTEEPAEEAVEDEEIDLDSILDEVSISIDEFFIVTVIDKNTLFPVSTDGKTAMTISVAGEKVTIKQLISGIFSKFNEVKEIKVPEDIIKNAAVLDLDSETIEEDSKSEATE